MSVRFPELLSYPLFNHTVIDGTKVEQLTIGASDETDQYSSEFKYDDFFQNTLGIIGIAMELNGNASDTITVILEYFYGKSLTWATNTLTIFNGVNANTNQYKRLDIMANWRDYLPFQKIRFKITKTGTNAACVITSRIIRV